MSQVSKPWKHEPITTAFCFVGVFCGSSVITFFFGVCLLFEEKDTREDGRLQYTVKEESSPLQRQQDFGQEILHSKCVRTQTDSELRILLCILSLSLICNSVFTCSGWLALSGTEVVMRIRFLP